LASPVYIDVFGEYSGVEMDAAVVHRPDLLIEDKNRLLLDC
jgi:hypothetical protein